MTRTGIARGFIGAAALVVAWPAAAQITVTGWGGASGGYSTTGANVSGYAETDYSLPWETGQYFSGSGGNAATGYLYADVGASVSSATAQARWTDNLRFTVKNATTSSVTKAYFYLEPGWTSSWAGGDPGTSASSISATLASSTGFGTVSSWRLDSAYSVDSEATYSITSDGWTGSYATNGWGELHSFNIYGSEQEFTFDASVFATSSSPEFTGVMLQAGATATMRFVLPSEISLFAESGTYATLGVPGSSPSAAMMPTGSTAAGGFQFNFFAVDGQTLYFDPAVAIGYDYVLGSGSPDILSAVFPVIAGDVDGYEIYSLSDLTKPLFTNVVGGQVVDFTTIPAYQFGISGFALRGIDIAANIDPADDTAFVTGLNFAVSGVASLTQTAITSSGAAVPEPATWAMLLSGFGLAGASLRRRRVVAAA